MSPTGASSELFDVAVIGGGVNGCGVARELQGRGARVILFEKDDLASHTSSASTKLIHGGLRYLEHYEFRLVREALEERERLWAIAPHIIWPLRFVLPLHDSPRPAWMLRLGLFLYDHIGGRRRLPPTRALDLTTDPAGRGLAAGTQHGFEYSDCWVDDARLVVLNAMDAAERGATIHTRTAVTGLERASDHWRIEALGAQGRTAAQSRILVNCAGPWVGEMTALAGAQSDHHVRLVRGSHIVIRRRFTHDRAYIFQGRDRRIVFAIPYEHDFTLIGTTDADHQGSPDHPTASAAEIDYLLQAASGYLAEPVKASDIVWSYSGVRPLIDDGSGRPEETTRDYTLELDISGGAPVVTVFGGKITTYRRLAESVAQALKGLSPAAERRSWSAQAALPGGDFPITGFEALVSELQAAFAWADPSLMRRLARAYGTRTWRLMQGAAGPSDLGRSFGAGLTEREVEYLRRNEWAHTADDILWRRSKLGLRLSATEVQALSAWLEAGGPG